MDRQAQTLYLIMNKCLDKINEQVNKTKDLWCPIVWDGALCWPTTQPDTMAQLQCPSYVSGFNTNANAYRYCTSDGTWFFNMKTNDTWTNYTDCSNYTQSHSKDEELSLELIPHIKNFRLISRIGYSVSFGTLLIAFFILNFVKRLRCPRNNLHLQLFASFMIRSFMFLIKYMFASTPISEVFASSLQKPGPSLSLVNNEDSLITTSFNSPALSCKIFTTIWQYSLVANYNWILMEGLYLHNLIFLHIFNDNSSIKRYIVLGWGLPILFITPWVVARALYEDTLCWTTNVDKRIFWIIRGPITATIILNFAFFINITRVLFIKMFSRSAVNYAREYRYRTWFKSTFILVPLFGVHYMFLLIFNQLATYSYDVLEIIWLYIDLLFSSFQGCVVALLYCFFNGEVQIELHKLWQNWRRCNRKPPAHQSNHSNTHVSYLTQSLTYFSRGRNSCFSTTATTTVDTGNQRKDTIQNGTESPPTPLRDQIQVQNMSHSVRNKQMAKSEPIDTSSVVIICDTNANLNGNSQSHDKPNEESKM